MYRLTFFTIFFTLVFVVLTKYVPNDEFIVFYISQYEIEVNAVFASFFLIFFVFLLLLSAKLIYSLTDLPKDLKLNSLTKKRKNFSREISSALINMHLGNINQAHKNIKKIQSLSDSKILVEILNAQTALLTKDDKHLRESLNKILKLDNKNPFALNGLGALAYKNKDYALSQKYLEKAYHLNKKAKNILPLLINSYLFNEEHSKLKELFNYSQKHKLIETENYQCELALNNFLIAKEELNQNLNKNVLKTISAAYKYLPKYFPIFALYIKILCLSNKYAKARKLLLENWHLYNDLNLIELFEIVGKNYSYKKQLSDLEQMIKRFKSNEFLPIIYAKIAISASLKLKEAEKILAKSSLSLFHKEGLEALILLKEKNTDGNSEEIVKLNKELINHNHKIRYVCDNCSHITIKNTHICPNCHELASLKQTILSEAEENIQKLLT